MARRYQPNYCEENIWWLASSDEPIAPLEQRRVVFISSETQSCLLFGQREHNPVVWDYHVILWVMQDDRAVIWDLDTALGVPCDAEEYLRTSFVHALEPASIPAAFVKALRDGAAKRATAEGRPAPRLEFAPRFLVLDAGDYVSGFASDRQHMVAADGGWYAPPPPWSCIEEGNLALPDLIAPRGRETHALESLLACATNHQLPDVLHGADF